MSEVLIVGIISAAVSLIGIFVASKNTRDEVLHKLDMNQQLMNAEIGHIKGDIGDMKEDIKEHNHYAKLFSESMPVVQEQIKVANHRIEDLENRRPESYDTFLR